MILKFASKILKKEWKKLLLPFCSIVLTGTVISTSFTLINSTKTFLNSKNQELLGGDMSFESAKKIDEAKFVASLSAQNFLLKSSQITFAGLVSVNGDLNKNKNTSANFKIIDENYPLYGTINMESGKFSYLKDGEVYIDTKLSESLGIKTGDNLSVNGFNYKIKNIVTSSPESLLAGFALTGNVWMSKEALEKSTINLDLYRKNYLLKVKLKEVLSPEDTTKIRDVAKGDGVKLDLKGSAGGVSLGLDIVERFLVVTILIIAILSLVNVYASVNYLVNRLRRSFAILIALGLSLTNIYKIIFVINAIVILTGTVCGIFLGVLLSTNIEEYAKLSLSLPIYLDFDLQSLSLIFVAIFTASLFATFPIINRLKNISPKELLSHTESDQNTRTIKNIIFEISVGIFPVTIAAIYLLGSLYFGLFAILGIVATYACLMTLYHFSLNFIYVNRERFSFSLKLIIAQKKFDGFLGLITFASLFVALTSVYSLSILRTSVSEYLNDDLSRTLPSTYVLDIQKSQIKSLEINFSGITLFPNVRARILEIDGKNIQKKLEEKDVSVDRELGREFNLTYRNFLLPNEKLIQGEVFPVKLGEVSLEKSFADRANIKIGSEIKFLIQGLTVVSKVSSIREADTRSGYPFFYFIFSPEELEIYPATFFGYANFDSKIQTDLRSFLTTNMPNANVIDTSAITKIAKELVDVLLIIIFIITIPPIILSTMLIVTIISSLSKDRKRDGARLMALGKENRYVRNFYIAESSVTVVVASVLAYVCSLLISNFLVIKYLKIQSTVLFDLVSFCVFLSILLGIMFLSLFLWRTGGKSLKEYLNYEENN